ncbi:D-alanyl-lipoteichoic acid biosynthesis protein DltD [Streptococcus gallolyticus]|uniref:D-alanyl-lipoteichoic acid biosynthesis protein DltD n=1 Tax=Streptococcus hepaticus TaxID=3349163 RepID=UPI001C9614DB|nr:D-alanyl-lipoteichoic acid biosynthesis protein DltD [Streptococcus gallolyticus]MBY5040392.1 D-alanyl-lipoteichoic acid biosynthesis protein DltD [Streptococcus gallolyticus]
MPKRLWQILGPLVCAASLIVLLLAITPTKIHYDKAREKADAYSLAKTVFKSRLKKERALSDLQQNFVPFFGSSEWLRMDAFHPAVLAEKYHRSYTPFLLGQRGSASISHYFSMQQMDYALKDKTAVYVISPQWFVKGGSNRSAFQSYFSNGQLVSFLQEQTGSNYDKVAARRLLRLHPQIAHRDLVEKVAKGHAFSQSDREWLAFHASLLNKEDYFFDYFSLGSWTSPSFEKQKALLPDEFSYDNLAQLATMIAQSETGNNQFGIKNDFYRQRIASRLKELKGAQKQFSYLSSPEYTDLQLVLKEFAESNTNVLFVIPPVNGKWARFSGLDQTMYAKSVAKIKYQLQSQGFTHIADLSQDGDKPYFMQDTIHLGWNGWLELDKYIEPFLTQKQAAPTYQLNDAFLEKSWAAYSGQPEDFPTDKK